jgi:tetratricopeptide (TPR) repeat protein
MPEEPKSPFWKANSLTNTGKMMMDDGSYERAVACFDEALKHTTRAWYLKGIALTEMDKYEEALECHEMVLRLNPDDVGALVGKGLALHGAKKDLQALEVYDKAIKLDPEWAPAWFNKACSLVALNYEDDAFDCLRKCYLLDPIGAEAHMASEESFDRLKGTPNWERLLGELRKAPQKGKDAAAGDAHAPAAPEYIR